MSVIEITAKAQEKAQALLAQKPDALGLKLSTEAYGCSGFGYKLDYVFEVDPKDEQVKADGFVFYVDRKSLLHLFGTIIDWNEDRFTTGFSFKNPNETGRCGCGESFMVEKAE